MHNAKTILITEPDDIANEAVRTLQEHGYAIVYPSDAVSPEEVCGVCIRTYTTIDKTYLDRFRNLSFVLRAGVGLDNIDLEACKKRDIQVYNAPGSNANAVAEYVVMTMLMKLRNVPEQMNELREGKWRSRAFIGEEITGKTIGLIGCGAIGKRIAHKLQPFGVTVLGFDPYLDEETLATYGIRKQELVRLLEQSDIISLHLPLTPETKHLISGAELQHMKPTSILMNTSRGELVNETDLIKALNTNRIAGAVLDVFSTEPEINKAFFTAKNVILSPHIAGFTKEATIKMALGAVENFLRS